jgi:hypothetical protein
MLFDLSRVLVADELFPASARSFGGTFKSAASISNAVIASLQKAEDQVLLLHILHQDDYVSNPVRQVPTHGR